MNRKQVNEHNKKVIAKIVLDEYNKRAIEFFNSQKVEISTKSSRWSN